MESKQFMFAIEGLDIAAILANEGKKKLYIKKQIDKYHYFIHHILEKTKYNRLKEGAYVTTSHKIMANLCGNRYILEIKAFLLKWGIVEANGKWKNGEQCQGYRLTSQYRDKRIVQVEYRNENFLNKLNSENRKKLNDLNGINKYLLFHLGDLTIDSERALHYLNERCDHIINNSSPLPLYVVTPSTQHESSLKDVGYYLQAINDFQIGNVRLKEDRYGRVHSNLTNLHSELRQFLFHRYRPMERLVNIDIVNSQPFFLAFLLLKHYRAQNRKMEEDVEAYVMLCVEGTIYEHFTKYSNFSRDEVKTRLLTTFYSRNTDKPTSFQKLFGKLFPNVDDYIRFKKQGNHRHFSRLMQKEESSMVIGTIIGKIRAYYGTDVFVATIHDSIVCMESDQPLIEGIIVEEITNKYSVVPEFKSEIISEGIKDRHEHEKKRYMHQVKYDALGNVA
ncbi:hypothetical protein [Rufibacter latericius]|uniref:DNA-directed DNA polymerase family A palm domain-containing protein n=1 Tax=Rufibacter latericius TaxID=2487040 RepID=A0A3M9MBS4_9BACT|nr:hypothetical protein [Rufibacter latericius]RNI22625.1 hypothetical protein EFB08_21250 [Rufibacter latericius]